jgi:aminoglycoside phosphotransferase (APT) family kinase protein
VLRKKPPGLLLPSAHAVDREFRVMQALGATDVPVPRMYGLCRDESILGTIFYVMDYVEGRIFWDPELPGLSLAERGEIYTDMNRTIARLHRVDYERLGLADFGRPEAYVARQVARWSQQYRASETDKIEAMERLIAWLPENLPADRPGALLHGDFRLDNLVFHATEPRIIAVLDWELSTLGDPLADFAYHMLTWHLPRVPYNGLADVDLAALGVPGEAAYRDAYLRATDATGLIARDWFIYLSYSLFRVAAIRQGIMRRFVDGNATSARAREAGALAGPTAEIAWAFALRAEAAARG